MRYFDILMGRENRFILRCASNGLVIARQVNESRGEFVNRCKRIIDCYNKREPNRPAKLRQP